MRGHGLAEPILVPGKRDVGIDQIVPVGRYAVRLVFSDGHDTGLFTWDALWELGMEQEKFWAQYETRLAEHKMSRVQIYKEWQASGFAVEREFHGLPWQHLLFLRQAKPGEKPVEAPPVPKENDEALIPKSEEKPKPE